MKVLIVEDDPLIREVIKISLLEENFIVYESENGRDAVRTVEEKKPEVILLDLNLPDISGLDVCKFIDKNRKEYNNPYIMIISAIDDSETVLRSFKNGADDYLRKPFTSDEVIHKIKRAFNIEEKGFKRDINKEILMDSVATIEIGEIPENLTDKEYELSKFFRENANVVCSREAIIEKVWRGNYRGGNRRVDAFVKKIRQKDPLMKEKLVTLIGRGYKLER
ncbi:response regulator transcription factor [Haliovirga abyssi]|uniref:DNA-binding response regulator n=1 Tax=Haliovirga abyssi TaxID=2996794 RepID=A0AAU9DQA2_9FUSO|nr:response regulator transcription factor [Haliovirga abyssi]BDU50638.1 DNA-binding response regulator [Haliovirga abyssi]